MNDVSTKKIIKKIFAYHGIPESQELNSVWLHDLSAFSADKIEQAWNEWRGIADNDKRKPKSMELIRILKARSNPTAVYEEKESRKLKHGRSPVEDELIRRLKAMNKNNPNLMSEIKDCDSPKEKIAICTVAAGQGLNSNSSMGGLIKNINARIG